LKRLICIFVAGCNPTFSERPSLVDSARVLAVRGEPAEARPGDNVNYTILVGGGDDAQASWHYCNVPKPLDENNIVSAGCLNTGDQFGTGEIAAAPIPLTACQLFGPDPPPQEPGKPALRPRDPDVSGGYYQPLRIDVDNVSGFGLERITCNLASAGAEIAIQFAKSYTPNQNPTLNPLTIPDIAAKQKITLTASWPPESAESYPVYDLTSLSLINHREAMRVSWFATAGSFEHDRTGRDETEMETSTDNDWTAPDKPGPVTFWVVLRDSRGGVAFSTYNANVN
jgi:hypothetical protein